MHNLHIESIINITGMDKAYSFDETKQLERNPEVFYYDS